MIIEDTNYFGKAEYQYDDPMTDIGFRLKSGQRVQAECTATGKDVIGKDECEKYEVYRSTFGHLACWNDVRTAKGLLAPIATAS